MDGGKLETFLAIVEEGTITKAARRLHLTQPAVSTQLARLEEEVGQRLFDRLATGVELTEAGRIYERYVREAVGRLEDGRAALDELIGLKQGSLAVGGGATATTYLLPPILGRFHGQYGGIRFFVREQSSQQSVREVLAGELDLAIVTLPLGPTESGGSARLKVVPWVEDELRLLVPPKHRMSDQVSFRWEELDQVPLVLFEAGSAVRAIIDRRVAAAQIDVDIVMELRAIESIKQMVAQGIGAGFVSQYALGREERGLRCVDDPIRRELAVIYRSDRTLSPAAESFLRILERGPGALPEGRSS